MTDLTDRINATIRHAQGRIERATFKVDHDDWSNVLHLLEDLRDELAKPTAQTINPFETAIGSALEQAIKRGPGRPRKVQEETSNGSSQT